MTRISRRQFLQQGGASLAGAMIAGSLAEQLLAAPASAPARTSAAAPEFPGPWVDDLASIVADLQRKFPYASALYTSQGGVAITRDRNGKRVSESGFPSRGVSLRVFDGSAFHDAAVGGESADALRAAARRLEREVAVGKQAHAIELLPALRRTWEAKLEQDPASLTLADRVARVDSEFDRCNWNDPRVRNVRVTTDAIRVRRVFIDARQRLASSALQVSHTVVMFGSDQGRPGAAFTRRTGQGGMELMSLTDQGLERLRKDFVESFGAQQMPAGEYDVVFAPEVSGLLAHESFGHGVEMDQFVKDRAKAREFLGKPVASNIVTLLDDPSLAGQRGSYPFDDEGVVSRPTTIIENGVFVRPLTDLMSATMLSTARTPNGRTQGWDRKVYARMSNTFFARGQTHPDEILAGLEDGLYLEGFRNGIEDPQGWGIQFTAGTAREYKNGKPTGKLFAPATVTGYVPDILSSITKVGNDFLLEPGTCGKGHKEFVPVTSGGPHIRTKARIS